MAKTLYNVSLRAVDLVWAGSPEEATKMVLLTQHYDTVTAVGANSKATIMMIPYTPAGMTQVGDQIAQALIGTKEMDAPVVASQKPPKVVKA